MDALCFLMMRKVKRIVLNDVEYPLGFHAAKTLRNISLVDLTLENRTTTRKHHGVRTVPHIEKAWGKWNIDSVHLLSQAVTVIAGVPKWSSGGELWETSAIKNFRQSWKKASRSEKNVSKVARALEKTNITARYFESRFEQLPFQGIICYEFVDTPNTFTTSVQGLYDGVSNTNINVAMKAVAIWNASAKAWK